MRIGNFEKLLFFESAILIFSFFKKKCFASSPWKSVTNYVLEWMGLNFYHYDGLQPKMSAGMIKEHVFNWSFLFDKSDRAACKLDRNTLLQLIFADAESAFLHWHFWHDIYQMSYIFVFFIFHIFLEDFIFWHRHICVICNWENSVLNSK